MVTSLEVQTNDVESVVSALVGVDALPGSETSISDDVVLRYCGTRTGRSADLADVVLFALTFPSNIAAGLIVDKISRYMQKKGQGDHLQRAFVRIEEKTEVIDENGQRTIRTTTQEIEIPLM